MFVGNCKVDVGRRVAGVLQGCLSQLGKALTLDESFLSDLCEFELPFRTFRRIGAGIRLGEFGGAQIVDVKRAILPLMRADDGNGWAGIVGGIGLSEHIW